MKWFFFKSYFFLTWLSPFSSDPLFLHLENLKNKIWNGKRMHAYTKLKIVINLYFSKKARTQEIKIRRKKKLSGKKDNEYVHTHFFDNFF